jgi:hypothetical protein
MARAWIAVARFAEEVICRVIATQARAVYKKDI